MPDEYVFELSGGRLCLDFANTVGDRPTGRPKEHLERYADLLAWARQAAVLTAEDHRRLAQAAEARPREAAAVLARAIALREAIYRTFSALAAGLRPDPADLATLNDALAAALARARVVAAGGGFVWGWADDPDALDRVLWPVARSAAELLTSQEAARVRECAADDCGWLFLDQSKNRSRRWCDMSVCGNRAKARRHYARRKADA